MEEGDLCYLERVLVAELAHKQRRLLGTVHSADVRKLALELERLEASADPVPRTLDDGLDGPDVVVQKLARLGMVLGR